MLLGRYDGYVSRYEVKDEHLLLETENLLGQRIGKNATPAYMITKTGAQYISVGNAAGGLSLFRFSKENEKQSEEEKMSVYPNPTSSVFYIRIKDDTVQHWKLYDMSSREVTSGQTGSGDIKNLPHGVYIVRVAGVSGHLYSAKIIKK